MARPLLPQRDEPRRLTREILARKGRIGRDLYGIGVRLLAGQERELWRPSFRALSLHEATAVQIDEARHLLEQRQKSSREPEDELWCATLFRA